MSIVFSPMLAACGGIAGDPDAGDAGDAATAAQTDPARQPSYASGGVHGLPSVHFTQDGDIAEIVATSGPTSASDLGMIESTLLAKYGL